MNDRNKKFVLNSLSSLLQQLVAIVCGLILPQLILRTYGSSVNGLTSSIMQFLSFITLLQGGVGTVARLAYYKPLADNDTDRLSIAYKTVSGFYKKFSVMYLAYLILMCLLYPLLIKTEFDFSYVSLLILILGTASVSEYFWGQASQMLLFSAQKNYLYSVIQIICNIISTVIGVALIKTGLSIHIVKLASVAVFTIRPLILCAYVSKKYNIQKNVKPDNSLLAQRKSALVRHIAFYIHTSTDIVLLSLFTNTLWVSVYSVHRYVVNSLSNLVCAVLGNTEAVFGDMIVHKECETMNKQIPVYDLLTKILSSSCFFTCMILINKFIAVYTKGVTDMNYYQPLFATVMTLAELIYCMGLTYQNIYIAAGHIKKTEWIAVLEAAINIAISLCLVMRYNILGVAIGTLVAMTFKSIANIIYMKKNVFDLSTKFIVLSYASNLIVGFVMFIIFERFVLVEINNYIQFFAYATIVFIVVVISLAVINFILFREKMRAVIDVVAAKFMKGKK